MLEIGVFLWVSYTSLPQEGGAQAQPIFRFPSIYPYTFDAGIHIGEWLVLDDQPRRHHPRRWVPNAPQFWGSLLFMRTP